MKILNETTISFKSEPFWYLKEKYGDKPNTVRVISDIEFEEFKKVQHYLKYIIITNTDTNEKFVRDLTDVSILPFDDYIRVLGKFVIFSWKQYKLIDE